MTKNEENVKIKKKQIKKTEDEGGKEREKESVQP